MIAQKDAHKIVEENYLDIYKLSLALLRNSNAAEDVTHDVFVFFLEKSETLEDININAWLVSVARNKIHEQLRSQTKNKNKFVFIEEDQIAQNYSDEVYDLEYTKGIDDDEILNRKDTIIKTLTEKERELFEYIYIQKMSYRSIAELLNISEKNAGVRGVRLRKKIKQMAKSAFNIGIFVLMEMK